MRYFSTVSAREGRVDAVPFSEDATVVVLLPEPAVSTSSQPQKAPALIALSRSWVTERVLTPRLVWKLVLAPGSIVSPPRPFQVRLSSQLV